MKKLWLCLVIFLIPAMPIRAGLLSHALVGGVSYYAGQNGKADLKAKIDYLQKKVDELTAKNEDLKAENEDLKVENAILKAEIKALDKANIKTEVRR